MTTRTHAYHPAPSTPIGPGGVEAIAGPVHDACMSGVLAPSRRAPLHYSMLATFRTRLTALFLFLALFAVAQAADSKRPNYVPHPASDLVCRPFGECEPCPEDDLDQPFCQPFGNRRLLHCIPADKKDDPNPPGEVPAWESCGKVLRLEQREFYEFVTGNLLFLIVCLVIYWVRTSTLATQQYRQLAARIGIRGGMV